MRYFYACIEQLDLAGQQLEKCDPSYGRFSLMLTDNIVELMLHRQCEDEIQLDDMYARMGRAKYNRATRRLVLGQHFGEKARFCQKIGKITAHELELITIAHRYRNELYHTGLKYDDIVYALAWHYHGLACELFRRFRLLGHSWRSDEVVSEAVQRHAGKDAGTFRLDADGIAERASASLSQARPVLSKPLAETLSQSALARVEEVEHALTFLTEDNPGGLTEAQIMEHMQFHDYVTNDESEGKVDFSQFTSFAEMDRELERIKRLWTPQHRVNPIPRWRARAERIAQETTPLGALRKYERLREDMSYFQRIVVEAAIDLDMHIQQEIDRARGK